MISSTRFRNSGGVFRNASMTCVASLVDTVIAPGAAASAWLTTFEVMITNVCRSRSCGLPSSAARSRALQQDVSTSGWAFSISSRSARVGPARTLRSLARLFVADVARRARRSCARRCASPGTRHVDADHRRSSSNRKLARARASSVLPTPAAEDMSAERRLAPAVRRARAGCVATATTASSGVRRWCSRLICSSFGPRPHQPADGDGVQLATTSRCPPLAVFLEHARVAVAAAEAAIFFRAPESGRTALEARA